MPGDPAVRRTVCSAVRRVPRAVCRLVELVIRRPIPSMILLNVLNVLNCDLRFSVAQNWFIELIWTNLERLVRWTARWPAWGQYRFYQFQPNCFDSMPRRKCAFDGAKNEAMNLSKYFILQWRIFIEGSKVKILSDTLLGTSGFLWANFWSTVLKICSNGNPPYLGYLNLNFLRWTWIGSIL